MSAELSSKVQVALWWITSIAASVLLCATFFVFFAGNLVDIRETARETSDRIALIEERENRILAEIELIRKRAILPTSLSENGKDVQATEAPVSLSVTTVPPSNAKTEKTPAPTQVETIVPAPETKTEQEPVSAPVEAP
ncbi:MAG: hypothetical protein PHS57_04040 [Alphaproteobacteria bacterium]|nr:hypothetical protein [Alphaproteobacteria bacterium]